LYKKARAGEISHFTGIHEPFEIPNTPDVHIYTEKRNIDECVVDVMEYIELRKLVKFGKGGV